jgi:hypothetical protein
MIVVTPRQFFVITNKMETNKINKPIIYHKIHVEKVPKSPKTTKVPIGDDKDLSIGSSKVFKTMINMLKEDDKYWNDLLEQQELSLKIVGDLEI